MGRSKKRPIWNYKQRVEAIKPENLGVKIQDTMLKEKHINGIFGTTWKILKYIRMSFHYMDEDMRKIIIMIIKQLHGPLTRKT